MFNVKVFWWDYGKTLKISIEKIGCYSHFVNGGWIEQRKVPRFKFHAWFIFKISLESKGLPSSVNTVFPSNPGITLVTRTYSNFCHPAPQLFHYNFKMFSANNQMYFLHATCFSAHNYEILELFSSKYFVI